MKAQVKVLIVDDEPLLKTLIQQKYRSKIQTNEMVFAFANNGIEALKLLKEDEAIGVIFTDLNMPEMDGMTLLSHLTELNRLYRTVVVSAYGDMENIRHAMNRGASDFITKPINLKDLDITINKTIEQFILLQQGEKAQHQYLEIQNELKIASSIQQAFIPHVFTPFPGCTTIELTGESIPAKVVGGDFFDFFKLSDQQLGFVIADVTGKGIPAALFMVMARTLIRAVALTNVPPKECLQQVNALLSYENALSMFTTTFYGILNIDTGHLVYCNGGHNPPCIISKEGEVVELGRGEGVALGAIDPGPELDVLFKEREAQLKVDDTLFLYTDGVTEAANKISEFYGEERLFQLLKQHGSKSIGELAKEVKQDIDKFADGADQADDITMLILRYKNGG